MFLYAYVFKTTNIMCYCTFVNNLKKGEQPLHKEYHDNYHGFAIDDELFGRLILEINQAGSSWTTILNKQLNFRKAYRSRNCERIFNEYCLFI